ncbi:MAG TPA: PQQ-binding-like beta-propeller repeat protein [Candidatus Baltobacteraceae bacterium]|nr:PQQ-binding-like beta-propeller repeat protein [Candidatus Baltobacteraceae bacterium]
MAALASCAGNGSDRHWTQFRGRSSHNAVVGGKLVAQWQLATGGRISASPAFLNGTVFVGTNAGTFYAIRAKDGHVLWKHHVANALMSAPLLYRGCVIVGEGNAGTPFPKGGKPVHVGTGQSALIAFDERSGKIRWRTPLRGSGMPTPAIVAGVLVHHDGSGRITGMDPMTGRLLFERNVHTVASMSAALPIGRTRFVTSGALHNAVLKVDARTGAVIWRSNPFPQHASGVGDCPLASDGKRVFGEYVVPTSGSRMHIGDNVRQHAYALDVRTGTLLWDAALEIGPLPINNEAGIPVVKDGVVYIGGAAAPWANALDAKTGRLIWRTKIYGPVKGAFVVKNGVAYLGDLGGFLWALDARTGAKIGVKPMPTSFNVGSPIIAGKTLVIGSFTGSVYAVPLQAIRQAAP